MTGDPHGLLGRWLGAGSLAFDLGAHEGKNAGWMLDLGARVVAVEPQKNLAAALQDSQREGLTVVHAAVTDHDGTASLFVADTDYVSTVESNYRTLVQQHGAYVYADPVEVPSVTLDTLIDEYGLPDFCKIDVEGHERAVFDGLTRPLPALCFEVHNFDPDKPAGCLARLAQLGDYEVFFSSRETFEPQPWPAPVDVYGDIYAVLEKDEKTWL